MIVDWEVMHQLKQKMKFKLQVVANYFNILYLLVPSIHQILLLFRISNCNRHVLDFSVLLANHGRHIQIMSLSASALSSVSAVAVSHF